MTEKKSSWKTVESHIVKWMVGFALTSILVAVGFYFNTNYVMGQNTKDIKNLQVDVKTIKEDVSKIKTVPILNLEKVRSMQKNVSRIEQNQFIMQKDMKEMMKVLYQIKRNQSE